MGKAIKSGLLIGFVSFINHLFTIQMCCAQSIDNGLLMEDVFEDISVNNPVDESALEDDLEELEAYKEEPLNLNLATRNDLERFPFLSDFQIEQLLMYLYLQKGMQSIYELQLVKGMDRRTIECLLPYVCVQPVEKPSPFRWKDVLKSAAKYGKYELITRFDIPFYRQKGYQHAFLGPPVYNSTRFGFRYSDRVYAGLSAEKDAGEPFGALHNKKGYDYYSFYMLLKDFGRLKSLAAGNYRMSFGQGLVVSNDYLSGKTIYASSFAQRPSGIRKHSSTDEMNYFRGMAATVSLSKQVDVSGFYSRRWMDGTIKEGKITSIYETGLHRTESEADKRNAFCLQAGGGNLSFRQGRIQLGLTGIYYTFSRDYEPRLSGYSKYNLHGRKFYNVGVDYAYRFRRLLFQGETAKGTRGWASLNRLQYAFGSDYQLLLIQRFYSYDYWGMFARAFGEGSSVQNEQGCYLGLVASPFAYWDFFFSVDLFSFPWKKYRISKTGSRGMDGMLQATYSPLPCLSMDFRYRYKQKERDLTGSGGSIVLPYHHHRFRYRLNYVPSESFSFRTTVDGSRFRSKGRAGSLGWQFTQMLSFLIPNTGLKAQLQGSYFHTDDYDSRVYIPEKGLLYTFYTPFFQGRGVRFSAHVRYDLNEHWMLIAKFGETIYHDRNEIGSGNSLIAGNTKSDLQLQLRIKF